MTEETRLGTVSRDDASLDPERRDPALREPVPPDFGQLEKVLGYGFRDPELLVIALTHRSHGIAHQASAASYERLEFLGDSVVGLVTARWLFERLPAAAEGELARWKSYLVSGRVLARLARRLELGSYLLLGVGEEQSGGRAKRSLLADAVEAVLGALFVDGGLDAAARVLTPWLDEVYRSQNDLEDLDAKTRLQELLQARDGRLPEYQIVDRRGPDHARVFQAACTLDGEELGAGTGSSKKKAQQRAASEALRRLQAGELVLEAKPARLPPR